MNVNSLGLVLPGFCVRVFKHFRDQFDRDSRRLTSRRNNLFSAYYVFVSRAFFLDPLRLPLRFFTDETLH